MDHKSFKENERYIALLELYEEKEDLLKEMNEINEVNKLKIKNLEETNIKLEKELDERSRELEKLKDEFSENTIIQSMNSMKEQYEELLETSIPKMKYDLVYENWRTLYKTNNACATILEHTINRINKLIEKFLYGGTNRIELNRINVELGIIKDILEENSV